MRIIEAEEVRQRLNWPELVDALNEMFRNGCEMPVRHHHTIHMVGEPDATLLLMPAWRAGDFVGVKVANVFPGNGDRGLPAVMGTYLLSDGRTGAPLAAIEGGELTARRTAAASALASRYLSRKDSRHLLMVGTGRLCPNLIAAHASVRPIESVAIWGRNPEKAARAADDVRKLGLRADAVGDLEAACSGADIVSCATLSVDPLIRGEWLRPGTHLDLVGAFRPEMRESDDGCIRQSRVFVDTRAGALKEAGDLVIPLRERVLAEKDVQADLFDLCRGHDPGRTGEREITLFKSVGAALEDLAAAILAYGDR